MKRLEPRVDLPRDISEALAQLRMRMGIPALILKLKNGILKIEESRRVGEKGISTPAEPKDWVSINQILDVVARLRNFTLERIAGARAQLGFDRYRRVRRTSKSDRRAGSTGARR